MITFTSVLSHSKHLLEVAYQQAPGFALQVFLQPPHHLRQLVLAEEFLQLQDG